MFRFFFPPPHLSVGGGLWYRADGRNGRVGHSGGQGHGGQGGHARLALLPLVGHEGRQRVELFLTLPAQKDVLVICRGERRVNKHLTRDWMTMGDIAVSSCTKWRPISSYHRR